MNADVERAPWDRMPGESAKAYHAFTIYRDMPPHQRSLRAVADRLYGSNAASKRRRAPGQVHKWSTRWRWVERAAAWDEEQDRLAREAQLRAIQEMRERHVRQAMEIQDKAMERFRAMDPAEMAPKDALLCIVEAAKLERLARGEPETIQEKRNDWVAAVLEAWARRQAQAQQQNASA